MMSSLVWNTRFNSVLVWWLAQTRKGKMQMRAGKGLQLPIVSTNSTTIFKSHWTKSWSLLLAKKFPLTENVPHKTALHTLHNSAPEYKLPFLALPVFIFIMHNILQRIQQLFLGLITEIWQSVSFKLPLKIPPPCKDANLRLHEQRHVRVLSHVSSYKQQPEGCFPPSASCKQRKSLFLQ